MRGGTSAPERSLVTSSLVRTLIRAMPQSSKKSAAKLKILLRGELDNVVLKALRKEPGSRYASVEQFADDIRRHLNGLPVLAIKGSRTYRAKKFVLRHKAAVSAAAIVIVAILGGAAATIREARIAQANARRAERRFNDVRKLANSFLFEIHDSIEHLQGSTPARELIVKRALEYLDSLSRESSSDPKLQLELVSAYEKVGEVQGSPYRDNLGNSKGARDSFQKAMALLEQLLKASPGNSDLRSQMARDYSELGDILNTGGDLKAAMECYRKGLDALESDSHPNLKTRIRTELLYDRYGAGLVTAGQLGKAADDFQRSLHAIDEVLKEDPSDRETARDKGVTSIHLGNCLGQMRRLTDALAAFRMARSVFESLAQAGNAQSARDIGVADAGIADLLLKTGDARGALAIHSRVYEQDQLAAKADPSDVLLRRDVFIDLYKLAGAQSALGRLDEAIANERKAVTLNEAEAARDPGSEWLRTDLETIYFQLGEILRKADQDRDALRSFEKAHQLTQSMLQKDPTRMELRGDLSLIEMNESDLRLKFGDSQASLAGYREALASAESLAASSPENGEWQILRAQLSQKLGEYYASQPKRQKEKDSTNDSREEALRWLRQAQEMWIQLQQQAALGSDYANALAETHRDIAGLQSPALGEN